MSELARFYGLIVSVFGKDHNPPHIHVRRGGTRPFVWTAEIQISDGRLLAGEIPPRDRRIVARWIARNRPALMEAWDTAVAGGEPDKIRTRHGGRP
jgi:LEA14-like dessication related protein